MDTEPAIIQSTGWLVCPTMKPGHVSVAQSLASDGALGEVLWIPESVVQEIVPLHTRPPRLPRWLARALHWFGLY